MRLIAIVFSCRASTINWRLSHQRFYALLNIPPPPPIIACWFSLLDVKNYFSAQITEPRSIDGDDDDDGDGNDGLLEYNNETKKHIT